MLRSLPSAVVEEQVSLYRKSLVPAADVASQARRERKLMLGPDARLAAKMNVGRCFHTYCEAKGIDVDQRLPRHAMKAFIADTIV